MAVLFGIIFGPCVDDLLSPERKMFVASAYRCWRRFADIFGWDIPDEKSPPPSQYVRTLGAMADMRDFPGKPILLRVAQARVSEIGDQIQEIPEKRMLRPALAGKLFGRLLFCSSQFYGNLGRSMIRAFKRRQYENLCGWNRQLEAACLSGARICHGAERARCR